MGVNVPGLIAIVVFYILIAVAGIMAARVTRKRKSATGTETITVGARDIGLFLGVCTMTATWFGGGAMNGSAESIYRTGFGLLWTIGAFGYGIGIAINGIFFAKKMREGEYVTWVDPMEAKLGKYFGLVFFAVELFAAVLYMGAILTALGGTLEVVTSLPQAPSVIISALVATVYTMLGGLYSVAYTDVIQLAVMVVGLVLATPFALTHEAVASISETAHTENGWLGTWNSNLAGSYVDLWLSLLFGGIATQSAYQRIFAAKTDRIAQNMCVGGCIMCCFLTVPPILIGAAAASTNWTMTAYMNGSGVSPAEREDETLILPIVLQYLTPPVVAVIGLGALTAAVMSSADSTMLAVSTLFGRNVYKRMIRPQASDREVVIVIRISIFVTAAASVAISLELNSVTALYYLCADFAYILSFPQFVSVLFLDPNAYGSIPAIIIGLVLRLGGGEYLLQWDPAFYYAGGSNFPLKTVSMLSSFITLNVISYAAKILFEKGLIQEKYDFLHSKLSRGGRSIFLKDRKDERTAENVELPNVQANLYAENHN